MSWWQALGRATELILGFSFRVSLEVRSSGRLVSIQLPRARQRMGNPLGLRSLQRERELVLWDSRQSSCWMQECIPEGAAATSQRVPVGVVSSEPVPLAKQRSLLFWV